MRILITSLVILFGLTVYGQESGITPEVKLNSKVIKLEHGGDVAKVTYYHDNGNIAQTGFVTIDKKNHGTWLTYHPNGEKKSIAHYNHGKKIGKWLYWKNNGNLMEVNYGSDNRIASAHEWSGKTLLANAEVE